MSELSAEAQALIEGARLADQPAAHDKARLRARLTAQLGAEAFAAASLAEGMRAAAGEHAGTLAKSASLIRSGLTRWFVAAAAAGGLAYGAYVIASPHAMRDARREAPAKVVTKPASPVVAPAPALAPPPPAPVAAEQPPANTAPQRATVKRRSPRAPARSFTPIGSSASMSAEIALLAQAQKALRARDGQQALRLAHQHAENFPSGALYEERLGIEAIAHCILGERAHPAVRAFLSRSPRSPLSARVRRECGAP
ncbi:MAG TPA: hypothetical protein VI299_12160 [Polyangiales bacterium]